MGLLVWCHAPGIICYHSAGIVPDRCKNKKTISQSNNNANANSGVAYLNGNNSVANFNTNNGSQFYRNCKIII